MQFQGSSSRGNAHSFYLDFKGFAQGSALNKKLKIFYLFVPWNGHAT